MTEGTSNSLFTHNVPPSFTITLVSSASMNVFKDNTLANFKNLLSEEINLQGEWRVAVTEITFPTELGLDCITHRVISDRVHRLLVTLSYFRPDRFVQLLSLIPILILLLYYLVSGCLTSLC